MNYGNARFNVAFTMAVQSHSCVETILFRTDTYNIHSNNDLKCTS